MTQFINCGNRKKTTCLKVPDSCKWNLEIEKCEKTNKDIKVERCAGRKEVNCIKLSDKCKWNGAKCEAKVKLVKVENMVKKEKIKPLKTKSLVKPAKEEKIKPLKKESLVKPEKVVKIKSLKKELLVKPAKVVKTKSLKKELPAKVVKTKSLKKELPAKVVKTKSLKKESQEKVVKIKPLKKESPAKVVKTKSLKKESKSPNNYNTFSNLDNRHCMYYNSDKNFELSDVINTNTCYKEKYDSSFKSKTNMHVGQRKLLLSEIQLLNDYFHTNPERNPTLIYVGAAPGTHLLLLSMMFPQVFFILYDGARFDKKLKEYPDVFELHEGNDGFMTTEKCKELTKQNISDLIFVSDIRLGEDDQTQFEHGVTRDMLLQQEWVKILKPDLSLLKFRMSYHMKEGETLQYMKGTLLYGIWPKPQSGESRLLVRKTNINKNYNYDFTDYEQTMFFHNKIKRPFCYPIKKEFSAFISKPNNPYCSCYDCMSELLILEKYSKISHLPFEVVVNDFNSNMNRTVFPKHYHKPELVKINTNCP